MATDISVTPTTTDTPVTSESAIKTEHTLDIKLDDIIFETSIKWYIDDEIKVLMMNKVNKKIFHISKTPKELLKLSAEAKIQLEPKNLYDLLVAGFKHETKDVILLMTQQENSISVKVAIILPLGMSAEIHLMLTKKEQNDVERVELIAKDLFTYTQKEKEARLELEECLEEEKAERVNALDLETKEKVLIRAEFNAAFVKLNETVALLTQQMANRTKVDPNAP
jgi:hypothetical protein